MDAPSLPSVVSAGTARDPPSRGESGPGAPAPTRLLCLPPGAQNRQDTLRAPDTPQHLLQEFLGARDSRAGIARATSCPLRSSPHPCAWHGLEGGAGKHISVLLLFCALSRRTRPASFPGGARWSPPGRPPRRGAGRAPRPDPPRGTHSGAAAALASWGLSRLPAPRPARSRKLGRASVRLAGNQPSRADRQAGGRAGWLAGRRARTDEQGRARSERRPLLPAGWWRAAEACQARVARAGPGRAGLPGPTTLLDLFGKRRGHAGQNSSSGPASARTPPPRLARASLSDAGS